MINIKVANRRQYILMLIDFLSIAFSCMVSGFILSFARIMNFDVRAIFNGVFLDILLFSIICVLSMFVCKVYKVIWRYARIRDFINCFAGIMSGILLYIVYGIIFKYTNVRQIYLIFSGCVGFIMVSITRIAYMYIRHFVSDRIKKESKRRIMIIGAGDAGIQVCNLMNADRQNYNPVAFIDDNSLKIGRVVCGIEVKGNTNEIPKIAKEMNISEIVLAIPSISVMDKTRILNICSETLCKVSTLPELRDYIYGDDLRKHMQSVKIEDLLGRDVVRLETEQTLQMIRDKVCMITGGGGSIGSELTRQIAKMKPKKLVIVDIYENNVYDIQQELRYKYGDNLDMSVQIASVRDEDKMDALFSQFKPDLVFHAAAHKHVPLMETNPEEALKNNIFGTLNTAKLAKKYQVEKFVLVSTDKAVNPTNIMGATKRCCEMIVECMAQSKSKTEFVAVRFGNVLGSNGSVIPLFEAQIAKGGPVTVTDPNIIRYFMTIPEASALILQAATMARGGEIFVLDMGKAVKILKLAENLIKLHGYRPYEDIDIVFTGLRPGEKLYEELLMDEEGLKNTANNKIFIGHQIKIDEKTFYESLDELKKAAYLNDKELCEELLKKIVPTFVRKEEKINA